MPIMQSESGLHFPSLFRFKFDFRKINLVFFLYWFLMNQKPVSVQRKAFLCFRAQNSSTDILYSAEVWRCLRYRQFFNHLIFFWLQLLNHWWKIGKLKCVELGKIGAFGCQKNVVLPAEEYWVPNRIRNRVLIVFRTLSFLVDSFLRYWVRRHRTLYVITLRHLTLPHFSSKSWSR